jgi:PAP2 superfamily
MLEANRELRAVAAGAAIVTTYTLLVLATGLVNLRDFSDLLLGNVEGAFSLWGLVGAIAILVILAKNVSTKKENPGPISILARAVEERWTRDYCLSLLWPPLLFALLMASFNAFKQMILVTRGFHYDDFFAQFDRILFFGHDPWRITHAVFGSPSATLLLDHLYHGWYAPMALGIILCAWMPKSSWALRTQYALTYLSVWILLGSVLAYIFPTAGPAFDPILVDPNSPFKALVTQLHALEPTIDVRAVDLQQLLLDMHGSTKLTMGAGISAMPSVHNALAVLFAIAAFRINRKLGWIMSLYAVLIWIGSIHLGWHYAIDGIVSAALTVGLWKMCGVATAWIENAKGPMTAVPNPTGLIA